MSRLSDVRAPLERFRAAFTEHLPADDKLEFNVDRVTPEGRTYLRAETYSTPTLSRLVMEEYLIGSRMQGTVIMAFGQPTSEQPIFFYQLGGVGDRSIAVLDISPVTADLDLSVLAPVHAHYAEALGLTETATGWLQTICSPYLLHCNYAELDEELFIEAMTAYLDVWKTHFHGANMPTDSDARTEQVTNALFKFKFQLHHHDPAYGFFARAWGKPAADAFIDIECGDHPAYLPPVSLDEHVKVWHNDDLNVVWTESAQQRVEAEADPEARRQQVEKAAAQAGFGIVTTELLERF
jgi:hypothetical protein